MMGISDSMDKDTYRKSVEKMKRGRKATLCCAICGESDPNVIEIHHMYGRGYSNETIPLCKNHHAKITAIQNKLPPKARSEVPFAAVSGAAFAIVFGEHLIDYVHGSIKAE